jgi:hypothetical protein
MRIFSRNSVVGLNSDIKTPVFISPPRSIAANEIGKVGLVPSYSDVVGS